MQIPGWSREAPGKGLDKPYFKVHGPKHYAPLVAIILGEVPFKGMTHYDMHAQRHFPCPLTTDCIYCQNNRGKRRKGYISAMYPGSKELFILELSDSAMNQLQDLIELRRTLRGLKVKLWRKPSKDGVRSATARVMVEVLADESSERLPAAFDETPHVFKMWGLDFGDEPPVTVTSPPPSPRPVPAGEAIDPSEIWE